MKSKTKLLLLIVAIIVAISLMLWGNHIMRTHEGYLEVMKAARKEALPQFISAMVILTGAYIMTYTKDKN